MTAVRFRGVLTADWPGRGGVCLTLPTTDRASAQIDGLLVPTWVFFLLVDVHASKVHGWPPLRCGVDRVEKSGAQAITTSGGQPLHTL
jgi:hypothetical protein